MIVLSYNRFFLIICRLQLFYQKKNIGNRSHNRLRNRNRGKTYYTSLENTEYSLGVLSILKIITRIRQVKVPYQ